MTAAPRTMARFPALRRAAGYYESFTLRQPASSSRIRIPDDWPFRQPLRRRPPETETGPLGPVGGCVSACGPWRPASPMGYDGGGRRGIVSSHGLTGVG